MAGLLFVRYRYALMFLSALLIKTILVQVLKQIIFPDIERPFIYFNQMTDLHIVSGVKLLSSHSFPSGHSTSVFCLGVLLALIIKRNYWSILFVLLAILTAYSRIYLGQHFSVDVYSGSIIGIVIAGICYYLFVIKDSGLINKISWIDQKISFRNKNER
jgi:membrane-associated phospholipid phosphatase